jgi:hypothetical protein
MQRGPDDMCVANVPSRSDAPPTAAEHTAETERSQRAAGAWSLVEHFVARLILVAAASASRRPFTYGETIAR